MQKTTFTQNDKAGHASWMFEHHYIPVGVRLWHQFSALGPRGQREYPRPPALHGPLLKRHSLGARRIVLVQACTFSYGTKQSWGADPAVVMSEYELPAFYRKKVSSHSSGFQHCFTCAFFFFLIQYLGVPCSFSLSLLGGGESMFLFHKTPFWVKNAPFLLCPTLCHLPFAVTWRICHSLEWNLSFMCPVSLHEFCVVLRKDIVAERSSPKKPATRTFPSVCVMGFLNISDV